MTRSDVAENEIAVRSLLMRLYHSRQFGEAFYPAQLVNGEAPELEAKGWIERHDQGWRMTDDGVRGWALMNTHSSSDAVQYRGIMFDEMSSYLPEEDDIVTEFVKCKKDDCNENRMTSSTGVVQSYCIEHQREYWRNKQAEREAKKNGATTAIPSLEKQRAEPPKAAEPIEVHTAQVNIKEFYAGITQKEALRLHDRVTEDMRNLPAESASIDDCDDSCADCVYKDVVTLLEKRVPGVRELVEGLTKLNGQKS